MDQRILIVEDETLIGLDLEEALRAAKYKTVGPIRTVAEALAAVERQPCDAALVDIMLPDGSSFVVAEALRGRGVPFAFISGSPPDALPPEFADAPFLAKPWLPEAIVAMIEELLGQAPSSGNGHI